MLDALFVVNGTNKEEGLQSKNKKEGQWWWWIHSYGGGMIVGRCKGCDLGIEDNRMTHFKAVMIDYSTQHW